MTETKNILGMNKRGIEFKSAFFAIIAISMVVVAVGVIVEQWDTAYSSGLSSDLGDFNKLDDVSVTARSQQEGVISQTADPGADFEATTFRGVFGIINNIFDPFRIVFGDNGMLDSVTERFGMPDYVRQGIVTMMIIAITFTLVAIIFRLPRSSA